MLKFIRRNANSLWIKAIFVTIVFVFMTWGVGAVITSGGDLVARVNGENIDPAQYKRAYQGMVRFYQSVYKDGFTPEIVKAMNLPGRTVEQLINLSVMRQEAERLGLTATDSEVRDTIAGNEAFQIDGRFNRDAYVQVLRANNMSPPDFQETQREEILIGKLRELIMAGVVVGEADVRARFEYDNEKVNLNFVKVDPEQYLAGLELSEDQLKEYYDSHQDAFRLPDRVEIEYVIFPNANFEAGIQIPESEMKEYYDAHQDEFHQEEQVRARHILVAFEAGADDATKTAARQRAEGILAKVKAGEDFAKLATENSDDSSSKAGGDLGYFRRGMMVPPFEEAAFALQSGQTSEIVESQFGYHIIRVDNHDPAGTRSFDQVAEGIKSSLKAKRAEAVAAEKTTTAHVALSSGKSLAEVAAPFGFEVKTAGPLAKTERAEGINGTGLVNAAFALNEVGIGPVVKTPESEVLFRVTNKLPTHVPELAAIRDQVEKAARTDRAAAKAKETAEQILATAKEKGLAAAAQQHGLAVEESGPVARLGATVGTIGPSPELAKQAFELTAANPLAPSVYEVSGSKVVAALKERIPADAAAFDGEKAKLIEQSETRLRNSVVTDFVEQLRDNADIELGKAYETAPPVP